MKVELAEKGETTSNKIEREIKWKKKAQQGKGNRRKYTEQWREIKLIKNKEKN